MSSNQAFKRLLQNESLFDRQFCDVVSEGNFSIFYNSHFSDDPIFNHVRYSDSVLEKEAYNSSGTFDSLEEIVNEVRKLGVPVTIYAERFWKNSRNLAKDAIDFGFVIIERMHVLSKKPEPFAASGRSDLRAEITRNSELWSRAFVASFGIPDSWIPELNRRLSKLVNDPKAALLVAFEPGEDEASGCLLFQTGPEACLGVYCVGTVPEKRSRGIARFLMAKVEEEAIRRRCASMTLQTLESDSVTPMYLDMGFTTAFERDVFGLRL